MIITLVKTERTARVVSSSGIDLGAQPELEWYDRPQAVLWLLDGTGDDIKRAEAHAKKEGYSVFTFPTGTDDYWEQTKLIGGAACTR